MPNKLVIGFLGMMVGGSAFLFTGLAIFLMAGQLQDHARLLPSQCESNTRSCLTKGPIEARELT
jgi:hypothetical protein